MNFLKNLEDNSILIIPNNIKNKILDYIEDNNLLINVKLLTFRDLKIGLYFDYNNQSIYHVMKKEHVNYGVAKSYINDLYYINEESYDNNKLNNLLKIKKDLIDNNLLIYDKLFKSLIKSKNKIYVYGFDYINKFNQYMLDELSKLKDIIYLDKENNDYKHYVFEFKNMEHEIIYVAEEIMKLVDKGVSLKKIYLANYSNEYYYMIHKIFGLYGIPYYVRCETTLADTVMGRYFINNLNNNLDGLLYKINKRFDIDNNEYASTVYNKLSSLVNTYYWVDNILDVKDLIIEEMRNTNIPSKHYEEEVLSTNIIDNVFNDDEYVFLIGFNLGSIPKIKKDEDYINDDIKPKYLETSKELNDINTKTIKKVLKNIKNITITYKDTSAFEHYFPTFILDKEYLVNQELNVNYSTYSDKINKLLLSSKLDYLIKFNEMDPNINILASNYDIPYKEYTNEFTGLRKEDIKDILEKKKLSYSTISNYYKCPFRFYLSFIYRLDKYEQTLDTFIGSLFHRVMEVCITDETKDIDQVYDEFIEENKSKRTFDDKDLFYIEKIRDEVHFIVKTIREQYKHSMHDKTKEWHEEELVFTNNDLDLDTKVNYTITGIIDKVLFKDNDCIIVDYKTGTSDKIDRELFEYGLTIQLPIYLYLLKNQKKNINIVGIYLQHILEGIIRKNSTNEKKKLEDIKVSNLRLDGLTLGDTEKIKEFDDTYEASEVIKSMKIKTDGDFAYKSRIMTYEEEDELYKTIKTLLENCVNDIADAKFNVSPLVIEGKSDGCKYCKYKDICFMKSENIRYIKLNKDGGETDEYTN